jgi:hypothetical protein
MIPRLNKNDETQHNIDISDIPGTPRFLIIVVCWLRDAQAMLLLTPPTFCS